MKKGAFILFLVIFFSLGKSASAQNITGIWEGIMGDEYLKINIIQNGYNICGYSFDFVLRDKKSYCKTYFIGKYDPAERIWSLQGTSFIENSGDHVLMNLKFWQTPQGGRNNMRGIVSTEPNSIFNFLDAESGSAFWMKKVSSDPVNVPGHESTCFVVKSKPKNKTNPQKNNVTQYNKSNNHSIVKTNESLKKEKSIPAQTQESPNNHTSVQQNENAAIPLNEVMSSLIGKINARKNITFSKINVASNEIEIKVYDNGIVDNDTISLVYNGSVIKNKARLTESPIIIHLKVDKNQPHNELILFAENLGGIPPNTALIVVTAGKKRYELHASANMNENAVLEIDYAP